MKTSWLQLLLKTQDYLPDTKSFENLAAVGVTCDRIMAVSSKITPSNE